MQNANPKLYSATLVKLSLPAFLELQHQVQRSGPSVVQGRRSCLSQLPEGKLFSVLQSCPKGRNCHSNLSQQLLEVLLPR